MTSDALPRVLFVEDEPLAAWTGRRILERLGCRVSDVGSCAAAEQAWQANCFDLVIVDHRLSDGCGLELLAGMRSAGRREPAICLTAEAECITREQREALGIRAVLGKPLDVQGLQAAVSAHAAAPETGAGTAGPLPEQDDAPRRVGRYELVACPARLTCAAVDGLTERAGVWVALDLSRTRELDERVAESLLRAAARLQREGGRLCLAGACACVKERLAEASASQWIDLVEDPAALASLSRKPASLCERAALLDSVV